MFKVSDIITTPPAEFASELQCKVYEAFAALEIPFERADTDPGITMEDCQHIDAKIGVRIVKTVFLCNRQQTEFYLYVTTDDTATCFVKIRTHDLLNKYIPSSGHNLMII